MKSEQHLDQALMEFKESVLGIFSVSFSFGGMVSWESVLVEGLKKDILEFVAKCPNW